MVAIYLRALSVLLKNLGLQVQSSVLFGVSVSSEIGMFVPALDLY